MFKRSLTVSIPDPSQTKTATFQLEANSPYDLVTSLPKNWKSELEFGSATYENYPISTVIPLHNPQGLQDPNRVTEMLAKTRSQKHIFEEEGLPNVKLVVTAAGKLLLFDGHHSLLAYLLAGKKRLGEIPYLVIDQPDGHEVTAEEIAQFFPAENRQEVNESWFDYVVNWNKPKGSQLEKRDVYTIGELSSGLGKGSESPEEE